VRKEATIEFRIEDAEGNEGKRELSVMKTACRPS
jgi:hypothetical protein